MGVKPVLQHYDTEVSFKANKLYKDIRYVILNILFALQL
jgi:hypothetical protein